MSYTELYLRIGMCVAGLLILLFLYLVRQRSEPTDDEGCLPAILVIVALFLIIASLSDAEWSQLPK